MKWRFAGVFLLTFAILLVVWGVSGFAQLYRSGILVVAQLVSPIVNGWWLDYDQPGMIDPVLFRTGDRQLPMLIQLPALSMGLMPLISLIVATPGQGLRRRALATVLGCVLYFLVDLLVVLSYPMIMDRPNAVKDTLGVFTGLMAFAVAPLGLWFVLTYPALRSLWQLSLEPRRSAGKGTRVQV